MRQLHVVCDLFRRRSHRTVLIARTIEDDVELAAVLGAIEPEDHLVVCLEAKSPTLVARLLAREPASWSGLQALVAHAQELAASMPSLGGVGLVFSTEDSRAEDVAERIISRCADHLGWTAWTSPAFVDT